MILMCECVDADGLDSCTNDGWESERSHEDAFRARTHARATSCDGCRAPAVNCPTSGLGAPEDQVPHRLGSSGIPAQRRLLYANFRLNFILGGEIGRAHV